MRCYLIKYEILRGIIFTIFFLFTIYSFSQTPPKNNFTDNEINDFIIEVFQDQATSLVFNTETYRYKLIKTFFKDKYFIEYKPEYTGKKFELLSTLGINNKYNKNLIIDTYYNPNTFNPLKYKFPLSSNSRKMYRIDNTDYIISIKTLN